MSVCAKKLDNKPFFFWFHTLNIILFLMNSKFSNFYLINFKYSLFKLKFTKEIADKTKKVQRDNLIHTELFYCRQRLVADCVYVCLSTRNKRKNIFIAFNVEADKVRSLSKGCFCPILVFICINRINSETFCNL